MCCDGEDRGRTERPCFPLHCSLVSPRTFKAQPSVRGADLTWGMEEWHLLSWRASRPCFRGRHAVAQPQHTPPDPLSLPLAAAHVGDWCAWLTLWMSRSFSHAPAASSSAPAPGRKRMGFHSASLHLTAPPHAPLLHPVWTAPTPHVAGFPRSHGLVLVQKQGGGCAHALRKQGRLWNCLHVGVP